VVAAKQACFTIHVENCYASGKTKRPRGPRSSLSLRRPHLDLQTQALTYYLHCHLQAISEVPRISGGLSESVSMWRLSGKTCPMVDLALSSMALAIFSRTQKNESAAKEASSRYHNLLQVVQKRIAQLARPALDERNIEACLLAVSLMGRYEGATHHPRGSVSNDSITSMHSWSHHDGAMAILKIWSDSLSHTPATFIIRQTRRVLIRSCLLRQLPLPDWLLEGSRFGEHGGELDFDRIIVRTVILCQEFARIQQYGLLSSKTEILNSEARDLDKALKDWIGHIPTTCSYRRQFLKPSDSWPRGHFYSSLVYSYPRPENSGAWSHYFALRMLVNSTRLKILEQNIRESFDEVTYEQQRLECITNLEAMADSLASSIPFCLERLRVNNSSSRTDKCSIMLSKSDEIKPYLASLVVWPLSIASSIEGIDVKQKLWFRSQLATIGRITGNGVLESAETDQWTSGSMY
jgi:hypothetical protein